ncbi:receptor-like serine/threonine-protein kinase SD1-6 [Pistacia vera]|uniref:receptor-like serine/threonine-protein kinase SD1-6 n=1 Tax=Pistacia vera TaxID=55513 RepID=UPI001263BAFB|nr:receptor-like serine/threonine-protein kinase SD1-6 [Pistacia vera]
MYNETYVVNCFTIGTEWIAFDDTLCADEEDNINGHTKLQLLVIIWTTTASVILLLAIVLYCYWIRKLKLKAVGDFHHNVPNLKEYTSAEIEGATNNFSIENKLGERGYGPVYKATRLDGQIIAVKNLAKTSTQGFEEFKNEVSLTVKLQHIPLDTFNLDWKKRVDIIEGIIQGLLYLQEYSRWTIIHQDLKVSNVLLDKNIKPKISNFGMARIFVKDDVEANTERIVGTMGYISPKYVRRGTYSTKSYVYSFGVLLLQIISGKRVIASLYGVNENLSLLEHAYQLWKSGKGTEFMDPSLDDTQSSCKLMRCLQITLLCVQENRNDRPSTLEVSSLFKNETTSTLNPKALAFLKQNDDEDDQNNFIIPPAICLVNEVTLLEVVAR